MPAWEGLIFFPKKVISVWDGAGDAQHVAGGCPALLGMVCG